MDVQKEKKRIHPAKILFLLFIRLLLIVAIAAALLLAILTVTEYKPADGELLDVQGSASKVLREGDSLTVMTWNVGYGALGDNADFFMDGGSMVYSSSRERVEENLNAIGDRIDAVAPDVLLLQEVDQHSWRSRRVDEPAYFTGRMPDYDSVFAYNYKVAFVPYPIPPMGRVESGLQLFSAYPIRYAERLQLPISFKWPVSLANLKRGLCVSRIPLEGSSRELVIIDLHLEAYDEGDGKAAQTKMLKDVLEEERSKGNYVIAGGDFNQIFSDYDDGTYAVHEGMWVPGRIETSDFGSAWQFLMDSSVPSCRSLDAVYEGADKENWQYYLIDGFIVSDNVKVDSLQTQDLDFVNSDHDPVVLKVTLQ